MGVRYDDWDKQRYKTTRSMPWWNKHIRKAQYIGWATIFIWAFGGIYKMLFFPPREIQLRAIDPRYAALSEDAESFRKTVQQREDALYTKKEKSEKKET